MGVLEEVESPINGKLTVVRDLAWGTHIKGGGLTQSGGVARHVWDHSLREVRRMGVEVKNCLLLGLGGAGAVKTVKKNWPEAKVIGVDIDPVIVGLGKKYLGLDEQEVEIHIEDAMGFVEKDKNKYDLIMVDMYVQDSIPEKFTTSKFYKLLKKLMSESGVVVFNRLYYKEKRKLAEETQEKLKKIFRDVKVVRPEANIMFVCST